MNKIYFLLSVQLLLGDRIRFIIRYMCVPQLFLHFYIDGFTI
jgi:hypothetical protein